MKYFRFALLLVLILASFAVFAFDPYVDLKDAIVKQEGVCTHKGISRVCFALEKDDKKYMVLVDNQGVVLVNIVTEWKINYTPEEITKVWERKVYTRNDT